MTVLLEAEKKRRQQFYKEITDAEKVEFTNGEIVVHSPVMNEHNAVTKQLSRLISTYVDRNDLGETSIGKSNDHASKKRLRTRYLLL